MAKELILCPTCGGLLAQREDLECKWKSCFACGRQFEEWLLPRVKIAIRYAAPGAHRRNKISRLRKT